MPAHMSVDRISAGVLGYGSQSDWACHVGRTTEVGKSPQAKVRPPWWPTERIPTWQRSQPSTPSSRARRCTTTTTSAPPGTTSRALTVSAARAGSRCARTARTSELTATRGGRGRRPRPPRVHSTTHRRRRRDGPRAGPEAVSGTGHPGRRRPAHLGFEETWTTRHRVSCYTASWAEVGPLRPSVQRDLALQPLWKLADLVGLDGSYACFICLTRHANQGGCDLPYLPAGLVGEVVAGRYGRLELSTGQQ